MVIRIVRRPGGEAKIYARVEKLLVEHITAHGEEGAGRGAGVPGQTGAEVAAADHAPDSQYAKTGQVRATSSRRRRFGKVYTAGGVALLAKVDLAHARLSGPATRGILEREYRAYGHAEYARLVGISVAHCAICARDRII
ncbi:MAG: hypothetical protein ABSG65_00505 [Bryobacteraceae bacterium]